MFKTTIDNFAMMELRRQLRKNITGESLAYGYTLTIWGSGALLLNSFTTLPFDVLAFVFGGVAGFTALALVAFKTFVGQVKYDRDDDFVVASTIHIFGSLGTVLVNYAIITQAPASVQKEVIFLAVGFNATFLYNIMLLLEEYITKDIYEFEKKLGKIKAPENG